MSVVLFTDGSAMCLYSYIRVIHDILWHDAEYYTWKNGGIRFFFFWNTRLENYCSSELDTAIGSPLGQVLEMVDRISFKIYIECRDFFFFCCLLGPIKETKFMRLVIGSSDEFSFPPPFFSFYSIYSSVCWSRFI